MNARSCPSCAAVVELPPERIADRCAFCETPLVDATGAAEAIDLVAGFDVPRDQAARRARGYLQGRYWAPEAVRTSARPENLHGVLVPFYVYDGVARSDYTAAVGVDWYRDERVRVNGRWTTRRVRETEWFDLAGSHARTYSRQLVSGSRGLPEAEANQLEPFDLGKARSFVPALTAGWIAERPSITHAEAADTVAREVAASENRVIRDEHLPGDRSRDVQNTTRLSIGTVELALLPVWIATFRHQGAAFRILVNGQTGETIGKVPTSTWKVVAAILVLVGVLAVAVACAGLVGAVGAR